MMRGPGIPEDVTRKALVANVDLAPTILVLATPHPCALWTASPSFRC